MRAEGSLNFDFRSTFEKGSILSMTVVITEILGTCLERQRYISTPPLKQYTPYSPTNIALIYINKYLFYNSTLKL